MSKAVAVLYGDYGAKCIVTFSQASEGAKTVVEAQCERTNLGKHELEIHQSGDITRKVSSTGQSLLKLGSFVPDANFTGYFRVSLNGAKSVIGSSVVLKNVDLELREYNEAAKKARGGTTGSSDIAWGVIGKASA